MTEERKRTAYQTKISEYIDRAEAIRNLIEQEKGKILRGQNLWFHSPSCTLPFSVKDHHEQIQIKDGSIGNSYEKLFGRFFDANVTKVTVQDPYIRAFHQVC